MTTRHQNLLIGRTVPQDVLGFKDGGYCKASTQGVKESWGLIGLSHGSRHPQAKRGVAQLVSAAETALAQVAPSIEVHGVAAHLEFIEPNLVAAASQLADVGVRHAAVTPLLFTRGYHARVDVPAAVAAAQAASGVELYLTQGVGTGRGVLGALTRILRNDIARGAVAGCAAGRAGNRLNPAAPTQLVLYAVGSSHDDTNADVERLAVRVQDATRLPTTPIFATSAVSSFGRLWGENALRLQATAFPYVHVLPLFVTEGLLLDNLIGVSKEIEKATGAHITFSTPLQQELAPVLAQRFLDVEHKLRAPIFSLTKQMRKPTQ